MKYEAKWNPENGWLMIRDSDDTTEFAGIFRNPQDDWCFWLANLYLKAFPERLLKFIYETVRFMNDFGLGAIPTIYADWKEVA